MSGNVWLTDLAAACRSSGLTVVEVPGWQQRTAAPGGSRWGGPGLDRRPQGIAVHHTATPASSPGDYPTMPVILGGNSATNGPLSQLGLGRSGTVYVIAAGICWHAGPMADEDYPVWGNRVCIGIEAENPGDGSAWPADQYAAYTRLVAALCRHYGIPVSRVAGHKEFSTAGKVDPTFDMDRFRAAVAAQGTGGIASAVKALTKTIVRIVRGRPQLTESGTLDAPTVVALQGLLGTVQDGVVSGQTDGDLPGWQTATAFQEGDGGSDMIRALQGMLNRRNAGIIAGVGRLTEDGRGGVLTRKALQRWLGRPASGTFTADDTRALQRLINSLLARKENLR